MNQGPSVLVLEDRNGYVFGGFAPANWALGPNFFGDDSCFLFTLSPRMRVYPSTGYNQHFQYLNLHQQTMPNGLAMGGQHQYCGLWIDAEYGKGHSSESCTTFVSYQQMSHTKEFHFRHMEVWGLGQPPPTPQDKGERVMVSDSRSEMKGSEIGLRFRVVVVVACWTTMRKARRCLKWPAKPFTVKVYANLQTLNHVIYGRDAQDGVTTLYQAFLDQITLTNQFVSCAKSIALILVDTLQGFQNVEPLCFFLMVPHF